MAQEAEFTFSLTHPVVEVVGSGILPLQSVFFQTAAGIEMDISLKVLYRHIAPMSGVTF